MGTSLWEGYLHGMVGSGKPYSLGVALLSGGGPGLSRDGERKQGTSMLGYFVVLCSCLGIMELFQVPSTSSPWLGCDGLVTWNSKLK